MDCVFCKIVNKEIKADIVYEDNDYLAFKDINPKAPIHILIIPKKHICCFHEVLDEDREIVKWLFDIAWKIIKEKNLIWCRLIINSWKTHWQEVFHIHLHLLS